MDPVGERGSLPASLERLPRVVRGGERGSLPASGKSRSPACKLRGGVAGLAGVSLNFAGVVTSEYPSDSDSSLQAAAISRAYDNREGDHFFLCLVMDLVIEQANFSQSVSVQDWQILHVSEGVQQALPLSLQGRQDG